VLGEDVEDEGDAIDDVDREQLLEVALLRGRELVVEDHDVDVERLPAARISSALPFPMYVAGSGVRRVATRHDRLGARGIGEQRELDR